MRIELHRGQIRIGKLTLLHSDIFYKVCPISNDSYCLDRPKRETISSAEETASTKDCMHSPSLPHHLSARSDATSIVCRISRRRLAL